MCVYDIERVTAVLNGNKSLWIKDDEGNYIPTFWKGRKISNRWGGCWLWMRKNVQILQKRKKQEIK